MFRGSDVFCDVCGAKADLVDNSVIYGHSYGKHPFIWLCPECGAYVGTHPNLMPMGALCGPETREARKAAHHVFDQLWNGHDPVFDSRSAAYRWLAEELDMSRTECHIGHMDIATAERVLNVSIDKLAARRTDDSR